VTAVLSVITLTGGRLDSSLLFLLEKIAISIILAVSLSLVVGFLGELSLGHAGFMCVGAYLGGKTAALLEPMLGNGPLTFLLSLLVGAGVAALCGIIIGIPALRLRGDYLAIVTLAFGEIVKSLFQNTSDKSFGGALGLSTPRYDKRYLFIFAFLLVLMTLAVVQNFIRSKHGRAVTSIRDNEIAARATGINVTKYKLLAFTLSATFAGIAGVLYSFSNYTVQSAKFGYNYSIEILVMVVLGGMGSINGSIIAAALITFLNTKLATILTGDLAVLQNLLYATILILIVIYNNAPALKSVRDRFNLKAMLRKLVRAKHDPSHVKDDEAKWDVVPTKIEMNEVLSIDLTPQDKQDLTGKGGDR
jgi:branched-chain amino acid transport system permease protein